MKTTESMNPRYILLYQTIVYILSGRGKARSPLPRSNSILCLPVFVSFFWLSMSFFSSYLVGHFISIFVLLFWFSFVRYRFQDKGYSVVALCMAHCVGHRFFSMRHFYANLIWCEHYFSHWYHFNSTFEWEQIQALDLNLYKFEILYSFRIQTMLKCETISEEPTIRWNALHISIYLCIYR